MLKILITERQLVRIIKEINSEDVSLSLLNEQWWKSIGKTILGATDLSDFLSNATIKLGRGIRKLDDITSPSEWFKALEKTPGKFRPLKDALLNSISNELTEKGIIHSPVTWVQKTDTEILKDLQKIGVTGDGAISYIKMFQGKHNVKTKVASTKSSVDTVIPSIPKVTKFGDGTDELIDATTKIFGVSTKSSEKLFDELSKLDSLVEISKKLNISKPKSVDEFVSLIKSSPKFTNEVVEEIFSNPTLRNQFDEGILQKLSTMEVESIKKLEKAVKSQDTGVLFHTKKSLKKSTTFSDNILDGLIKSFKKKHGLMNVPEPLVTTIEKKSDKISNGLSLPNKTTQSSDITDLKPNTLDTKVSVTTPKLGLPGIPEPEIYLQGTRNGLGGIQGNNLTAKLDNWTDIHGVLDNRKNQELIQYSSKGGKNVTTVQIPKLYELSKKRLIYDDFNREGVLNFSFVTPEKYISNSEFAEKVRNKFIGEVEKLADKYQVGFYGQFKISDVSDSDWSQLMNTMKEFLKSPH